MLGVIGLAAVAEGCALGGRDQSLEIAVGAGLWVHFSERFPAVPSQRRVEGMDEAQTRSGSAIELGGSSGVVFRRFRDT